MGQLLLVKTGGKFPLIVETHDEDQASDQDDEANSDDDRYNWGSISLFVISLLFILILGIRGWDLLVGLTDLFLRLVIIRVVIVVSNVGLGCHCCCCGGRRRRCSRGGGRRNVNNNVESFLQTGIVLLQRFIQFLAVKWFLVLWINCNESSMHSQGWVFAMASAKSFKVTGEFWVWRSFFHGFICWNCNSCYVDINMMKVNFKWLLAKRELQSEYNYVQKHLAGERSDLSTFLGGSKMSISYLGLVSVPSFSSLYVGLELEKRIIISGFCWLFVVGWTMKYFVVLTSQLHCPASSALASEISRPHSYWLYSPWKYIWY